VDSVGSGQGPVAGCYEHGDEPSRSDATALAEYSATLDHKTSVSPNESSAGVPREIVIYISSLQMFS
jgi:hypothetical protein